DARQRDGVGGELLERRAGEVGGRQDGAAVAGEGAQAEVLGARALHLLDLAEAHADVERVALGDDDVGGRGAVLARAVEQQAGDRLERELAHACVPPTVIASILIVGMPTPTGTDWPSLPHVPMPSSSARSLPTIDTFV